LKERDIVSADKIQNTSSNVDLSAYDKARYCHGIDPEEFGTTTGGEDRLVQSTGGRR
jgi:hypothetical protein